MHSENQTTNQNSVRRSFIEEARRTQIITAAVDVLADIGYGKASLAQIAKRANISASLILYHFADKDELMRETLTNVLGSWLQYVETELAACKTATDKLHVYIEANLAYMGTRPRQFEALIEILFNARDEQGALLYRADDRDPGMAQLEELLREGQQSGEFRPFEVTNTAIAIRGTIDQFLGQIGHRPEFNLEEYTARVLELIDHGIMQERKNV